MIAWYHGTGRPSCSDFIEQPVTKRYPVSKWQSRRPQSPVEGVSNVLSQQPVLIVNKWAKI